MRYNKTETKDKIYKIIQKANMEKRIIINIDVAKELGVTRQATHQTISKMIAERVVKQVPATSETGHLIFSLKILDKDYL